MGQWGGNQSGALAQVDYANTISGTPSYTSIGEVYDIQVGGVTVDVLDVTAHGDSYRNFVPGLRDGGEISLSIRRETDNAQHKALYDNAGTGPFALKIEWPPSGSGVTTPFSIETDAFLTDVSENIPVDAELDLTASFKLTGAPTITAEA